MLVIGADHMAAATGNEALVLLAIPILWMAGVLVFVAHKLRTR